MFIKNRVFKDDEDTLLEVLFDFDLGEPTAIITAKRAEIEADLKDNTALRDYLATIPDEEERLEVATDERAIRLAESLMADYSSFQVQDRKLFGIAPGRKDLLYEINL